MDSGHEAVTEVLAVDVPGGALAVEHVAAGTSPMLAVHGISSQRKLWNWLRAARPDLSLIAPDLCDRGDSVGVTGPSSVARHAADLVAVLDHLALDRVPVCGMSMGGSVAVELATAYPDRVTSLVLVDGGLPMATPPGLTPGAVPAIFRDRLARLDRAWAGQRVRLDAGTLIADATDIFFGPSKWEQVAQPVRLLTAERSTGRGSDHAASIMSPAGARATADLISEAL